MVAGWPVGPPLLFMYVRFNMYVLCLICISSRMFPVLQCPIGPLLPCPSPLPSYWCISFQSVTLPPGPLLIGCSSPYKTPGPSTILVFRSWTLPGINLWTTIRRTPLSSFICGRHFWCVCVCDCALNHASSCGCLRGGSRAHPGCLQRGSASPRVPDSSRTLGEDAAPIPSADTAGCVNWVP